MITRGGINLNISESNWDSLFKSLDEKERAEKILNALSGMTVFSAKGILDTCKKLIEFTIPPTVEEQKALIDKINEIFEKCFPPSI